MASITNQRPLAGSLYNYYFVGHGAQFRVYAVYTLDNKPTERVIKVPLDFQETRTEIFEPLRLMTNYTSEDDLNRRADIRTLEVMQFKHDLPNLLQGILGKDKEFMSRLGQLRILQKPIPASTEQGQTSFYLPIFFTQDYVTTLDTYLQHFRLATISYTRELDVHATRALKSVIRQIIDLNYMIWEYGVFEFVFKPENIGIRQKADGHIELIWMDLAEHITDLEQAARIIGEKRWLHPLMPHKIDYQFMPTVLHEYYTETLNAAFTEEILRRKWRRKCLRAEERHAKQLRLKELLSRDSKASVGYWVARHNLHQSLYRGFPDYTVDDMEIPVEDLQLLLHDKHRRLSDDTGYIQEKIEREKSVIQQESQLLFPFSAPNIARKAGS